MLYKACKQNRPVWKTSSNLVNGYTLIELMIALLIFVIITAITASVIYSTINIKTSLQKNTNLLNNIEITFSLLNQDINQMLPRKALTNDLHVSPSFSGNKTYFEFSRAGNIPITKNSSLSRVAYLCKKNSLIRRQWQYIDDPNKYNYKDNILLRNIQACNFYYLNDTKKFVDTWVASLPKFLPIAIKININLTKNQAIHMVWVVPT